MLTYSVQSAHGLVNDGAKHPVSHSSSMFRCLQSPVSLAQVPCHLAGGERSDPGRDRIFRVRRQQAPYSDVPNKRRRRRSKALGRWRSHIEATLASQPPNCLPSDQNGLFI